MVIHYFIVIKNKIFNIILDITENGQLSTRPLTKEEHMFRTKTPIYSDIGAGNGNFSSLSKTSA